MAASSKEKEVMSSRAEQSVLALKAEYDTAITLIRYKESLASAVLFDSEKSADELIMFLQHVQACVGDMLYRMGAPDGSRTMLESVEFHAERKSNLDGN